MIKSEFFFFFSFFLRLSLALSLYLVSGFAGCDLHFSPLLATIP